MTLIYFSPVPWNSFSQRPHHFVSWYQARFQSKVIWVDPYPSRFPRLSDIFKLFKSPAEWQSDCPEWLTVIKPRLIPLEPLRAFAWINIWLWKFQFPNIATSSGSVRRRADLILVIGKPSEIALSLARQLNASQCVLDVMDDFSEFHTGLANRHLKRLATDLLDAVGVVWTSSTHLYLKCQALHKNVLNVPNAVDDSLVTVDQNPWAESHAKNLVAGYVGTIGEWFDWEWLCQFGLLVPNMKIELIGPVFGAIPKILPLNISIHEALPHEQAIARMRKFSMGLIPFKNSKLTISVDPIKYYEYRSIGLPVVSSNFGEMQLHGMQPGVFVCSDQASMRLAISQAIIFELADEANQLFIRNNNWRLRFNQAYEKCPFI